MKNSQGSLEQLPLAMLLHSIAAERGTGTLQVRNGPEAYVLCFLFGHLFHAYGSSDFSRGSEGEDAAYVPLGWSQGEYTFDSKPKLPAKETIKTPLATILAEAKRRGCPGA